MFLMLFDFKASPMKRAFVWHFFPEQVCLDLIHK